MLMACAYKLPGKQGLGKTVQIIGLLSALLRKKGNGLDLFELQCRRRNVAKAKEEYKLEKLNALMNGSHLPDESELAKCQNLPSWAPILLVVPTAVFQNWLNEFNVWGYFGVAAYSGPKREEKIEDIKTGAAEILLCGVTFFRQEFAILKEVDWKLIIIDEFHSFKVRA
jgi:SNF2 family DNA or RNA helicase